MDEWVELWAALRHVRAMNRGDLAKHAETEILNQIIAAISQKLFPQEEPQSIEASADAMIEKLFGRGEQ
jgi:hypothetical protein